MIILGKSIYSTDAALLLSTGVRLSPTMVKALKKNNIYYIYIEDGLADGIEPDPIIPDSMKIKLLPKWRRL